MIYSLQIQVEQDFVEKWMEYMETIHIQDVLQTGCFTKAVMYRLDEQELIFRIDYHANSKVELERYLSCFAKQLRDDHVNHFPKGVTVTRNFWNPIFSIIN